MSHENPGASRVDVCTRDYNGNLIIAKDTKIPNGNNNTSKTLTLFHILSLVVSFHISNLHRERNSMISINAMRNQQCQKWKIKYIL